VGGVRVQGSSRDSVQGQAYRRAATATATATERSGMARQAFVFSARLDGWKGVRRTIAVRSDQTLAVLHDAADRVGGLSP